MYKDGIVTKIDGQRYWIPYAKPEDKALLDDFFKNSSLTKYVQHSLFGRLSPEKKRFRKLLNQIIRAKNNPLNANQKTITVKLSDKTIKVTSLKMKSY